MSSQRGQDWLKFSQEVFNHIENYTVPQYGDKGEDQCTEFKPEDFITQIRKYLNRHGSNSRPGQDRLDKIKVAHYSQMLADCMAEPQQDDAVMLREALADLVGARTKEELVGMRARLVKLDIQEIDSMTNAIDVLLKTMPRGEK